MSFSDSGTLLTDCATLSLSAPSLTSIIHKTMTVMTMYFSLLICTKTALVLAEKPSGSCVHLRPPSSELLISWPFLSSYTETAHKRTNENMQLKETIKTLFKGGCICSQYIKH